MPSDTPQKPSAEMTGPLPTTKDSSSTYANDPLLQLLSPKALHLMSQDEIREQVNLLRTQRLNAQGLGKLLRGEAAKEAARPPVQKTQKLDDVLGELGL